MQTVKHDTNRWGYCYPVAHSLYLFTPDMGGGDSRLTYGETEVRPRKGAGRAGERTQVCGPLAVTEPCSSRVGGEAWPLCSRSLVCEAATGARRLGNLECSPSQGLGGGGIGAFWSWELRAGPSSLWS